MRSLQNPKRKGFTLIELLLVVVILASIATMVVANLSFAEDRAKSAVTGSTIAQVTSSIETYKTSTGSYPLGLDALIEDPSGTPALYGDLWGHSLVSLPNGGFGPLYDLKMKKIDDLSDPGSYASSLAHVFSAGSNGNVYLHYHAASPSSNPANSGSIKTVVTDWGDTNLAFVKKATASSSMLRRLGYNNGIPADVEIIALGIGNRSGLRETMTNAPTHVETDGKKYYNRYIAYFAIYQNGKHARLKTVVDSYGVDAEGNVEDYEEAAPEHE